MQGGGSEFQNFLPTSLVHVPLSRRRRNLYLFDLRDDRSVRSALFSSDIFGIRCRRRYSNEIRPSGQKCIRNPIYPYPSFPRYCFDKDITLLASHRTCRAKARRSRKVQFCCVVAVSIVSIAFHSSVIYYNNIGGVLAMSRENFLKINGYSNLYWGWGQEDDDMSAR